MKIDSLFNSACEKLREASVENYRNEARWIFESVFDKGRELLLFGGASEADDAKAEEFLGKIIERASGRPLQYVIGSWDFYGETFNVGEGVLIPRPETELLVDFALDFLKGKENPVIFDLCSGSGCIGLSVAKAIPDSKVYLLEKSPEAFRYLESNKRRLSADNAELINGDLFDGFSSSELPAPDLILSNPPYIESSVVPTLMNEVLREPTMALDGGEDGYDFYRAIASHWLPSCKGAVAVECGEGQAKVIADMFSAHCAETGVIPDFNMIDRVVYGFITKGN